MQLQAIIIKRNKGIPALLIATNSNVSPRLPNVIIEESNIPKAMLKEQQ
jgi:hypothetical protein